MHLTMTLCVFDITSRSTVTLSEAIFTLAIDYFKGYAQFLATYITIYLFNQ